MQTAMQELIERLKTLSEKYQNAGLLTAIEIANSLLEMEKEQKDKEYSNGYIQGCIGDDKNYSMELDGSKGSDDHIVDTNKMVDQVPDVRKMVENDNVLTPVDWLMDRVKWIHKETYNTLIEDGQYDIAKKMESTTSSQTEISDEEIEKFAEEFTDEYYKVGVTEWEVSAFVMGMKKYREQLKQRQ